MTIVYCLMGPTGSGKSTLAAALSERFPVEVISVDSAQIYRYLDIGTAKPSPAERRRVPHHLIDICDPDEQYSAAQFREDALREIEAIRGRGRIPLLVGGTGLYFRVLTEGIATLPSSDPETRARLEAELAEHGSRRLHARLKQVDPVAARRIHPNDPQRLVRALEVFEVAKEPMTKVIARAPRPGLPYPVRKLGLVPDDRNWLRDVLEARYRQMLERGLVNEVRSLFDRGLARRGDPALKLVGYREVTHYLDGAYDLAQLVRLGSVATRQLAKRQMTWLRRERDLQVLDPRRPGLMDSAIAEWGFDDKSGT